MMERPTQQLAGARFRGLLIIWGAQLASLAVLWVLMRVIEPDKYPDRTGTVIKLLAFNAILAVVLSFVIKSKQLAAAVRLRKPEAVTTGYVLAFALSEVSALLGLLCHFVAADPRAIYFLALTAVALALHFPRRRHVEAASGDQGQTFTTTL